MRLSGFLVFFLFAAAGPLYAQDANPLAGRLAAQNALFEEQYQSDLLEFPLRATAFGDYRYDDTRSDYSLAAIVRRNEVDRGFLSRLRAIPTSGFSDQDQLSADFRP